MESPKNGRPLQLPNFHGYEVPSERVPGPFLYRKNYSSAIQKQFRDFSVDAAGLQAVRQKNCEIFPGSAVVRQVARLARRAIASAKTLLPSPAREKRSLSV